MSDNADIMTQPNNLPPGLPPLPPVPPGFDRWEYQGEAFSWNRPITWACATIGRDSWGIGDAYAPSGVPDVFYIEAVRDEPAPATAPPCDCTQGYVQETGFDRCEKCNAAFATEAKGCEGVESRVCQDIAARQRLGIAKYGCTVADSNDDMLQHAYEEALDLAVYLKAEIEKRNK